MVTSYKISVRNIRRKTQDVVALDRKIKHFLKHKTVIINKGLLKNYKGIIVSKPVPIYTKKDFFVTVRLKDFSKSVKRVMGTNKFRYKGSELKPTAKTYKRVLPKWSSDIR